MYVAVTTDEFFWNLYRARPQGQINFWRPGSRAFRAIGPGEPFLFKLHSPDDRIAGGGVFVQFERMPVEAAWEKFGIRNGAPDITTLRLRVEHLREKNRIERLPDLGCIILRDVFYLPADVRLNVHNYVDFPLSVVQGKVYDCNGSGKWLWDRVQELLRMAA